MNSLLRNISVLGVSCAIFVTTSRSYASDCEIADQAFEDAWMIAYASSWDIPTAMILSEELPAEEQFAFFRGWLDAWKRYLQDSLNPGSQPPLPPPPPPPPPREYTNEPRPW